MFPKAKIHRFNDDTSCAPPPGTYDPKIDAHVPNVVIPSSKRFPDQLFNSTSLENLKKATPDLQNVVFRTPQPSRKKIPKTPQLASLQANNFSTPDSSSSIYSSKSEESLHLPTGPKTITRSGYVRLEQQYSALSDKFKYVTLGLNLELSKLKDELLEIKTHEAELRLILDEKNELESERSKELLQLKKTLDIFEQKLVDERLSHKKYISDLETELEHAKEKREELEGIISTKEAAITCINEKYNNLEHEMMQLKEELENKNEVLLEIKVNNSDMLDTVVSQSQEKLDKFEKTLYSKVQNLEIEFESKLEQKEVDFETKLNYFSNDFDNKKNCVEKEVSDCLSRVSELQDFVDKTTKGITKDIEEANERCKLMFRELCKVESDRDDLLVSDLEKKLSIIEIQGKCDEYANECESFKEKCKNYEITLNSMRLTVQVLSTRLVESENEVERLSLAEVDLTSQKKLLEEKSQLLLADIMTLREGMARLEKEIVSDIAVQREHLAAKVEAYKAEVSRQVGFLNDQINEKQSAINMLLQENDYFKNGNEQKDSQIKQLHYKGKQYKEDILQLKTSFSKLEDDFSEKLSAQKNLYEILNDKLMKSYKVIDDLTALKANNDVTIASLLNKNDTYQKQLSNLGKELDLVNTEKIHQEGEISSLKNKVESNKIKLEKYEDENVKQQLYIDGLVSDLVLEKERCVVLENEKEEIKKQLVLVEIDCNAKFEEIESLKSKHSVNKAEHILELTLTVDSLKEEIDAKQIKITSFEVERADFSLQLQQANHTVSSLRKEIEKLQTQINCLEAKKSHLSIELEDSSYSIETLKKEVDEKETKITCLETEKDGLSLQLDEANYTIANLKNEMTINENEKIVIISQLKNQIKEAGARDEENNKMIESLQVSLQKQIELFQTSANCEIELTNAQAKISELEDEIKKKNKDIDLIEKSHTEMINNLLSKLDTANIETSSNFRELEGEVATLKSEKEELEKKLRIVTDERDELDKKVTDLVGHHNNLQRIRHVQSLKQLNNELKEENERLAQENARVKAQLHEFKENPLTPRVVDTPRPPLKVKSAKKLASPGVLKERNH